MDMPTSTSGAFTMYLCVSAITSTQVGVAVFLNLRIAKAWCKVYTVPDAVARRDGLLQGEH